MENISKAFMARLAYERNCEAKYDRRDGRPSRQPPKGYRMGDYAFRFGVTVEEMKTVLPEVEKYMEGEK